MIPDTDAKPSNTTRSTRRSRVPRGRSQPSLSNTDYCVKFMPDFYVCPLSESGSDSLCISSEDSMDSRLSNNSFTSIKSWDSDDSEMHVGPRHDRYDSPAEDENDENVPPESAPSSSISSSPFKSSQPSEENIKTAEQPVYEAELRQYSGAYVWPKVHMILPDDPDDDRFPKNVDYLPIQSRPKITSLQCHAEGFAFSCFLDGAARHAAAGHTEKMMQLFLLFFSNYLDNLRRFAAPSKPLTCFPGDTYDADVYKTQHVSVICEQVSIDNVAVHARAKSWCMNHTIRPREDGKGFTALGEYNALGDNDIRFTFDVLFARRVNQKGVSKDYLRGKFLAKNRQIRGAISLAEHYMKYGCRASIKLASEARFRSVFASKHAGGSVQLDFAEIPEKSTMREIRRDFRKRLNRVKTKRLPDSDVRFRRDVRKMAKNYFTRAEYHYNLLCDYYLRKAIYEESDDDDGYPYRPEHSFFQFEKKQGFHMLDRRPGCDYFMLRDRKRHTQHNVYPSSDEEESDVEP